MLEEYELPAEYAVPDVGALKLLDAVALPT
jgi:hypothetical protein